MPSPAASPVNNTLSCPELSSAPGYLPPVPLLLWGCWGRRGSSEGLGGTPCVSEAALHTMKRANYVTPILTRSLPQAQASPSQRLCLEKATDTNGRDEVSWAANSIWLT